MAGLTKFIYRAFAIWVAIFVVVSSFGSSAVIQVIRGLWPLLTLPVAIVFIILSLVAIRVSER
jgi:hypothetical protein